MRQALARWGWPLVCAIMLVVISIQRVQADVAAERIVLLQRVDQLQLRWCSGIEQVNRLCEQQFIEMMERLGLDDQMMPLVPTVLWRKTTGNFSIDGARELMGARSPGTKYLENAEPPEEVDEQMCVCR